MGTEHARGAEIHLPVALQTVLPALGHVGNGIGRLGEHAVEGILGAAMDDALGFDRLLTAKIAFLEQQRRIAGTPQPVEKPQAGNAAPENCDIDPDFRFHGLPSV